MKIIFLKLISLYKKFISPYKGFRCAYGVLHGGDTCSSVVYSLIERHGVVDGYPLISEQFNQCNSAYHTLLEEKKNEPDEDHNDETDKCHHFKYCDLPYQGIDCLSIGRCGGRGTTADCDAPCGF